MSLIRFLIATTALLLSHGLIAVELTADAIVDKANLASYYAGKDGRTDARMKIVDAQDRVQYRQFVILRKDQAEGSEQSFLVVFSRPADVRDTVFLVHKKPQGDDNRWLYLPGLDLVKRISAGDKRTSFVGSHFYYEDVSGRTPSLDQHELIKSDDEYYYLKHTPIDADSVEFAYYTTKIDKKTFLPMVVRYFNGEKDPIRTMEVLSVETVEGYPTVTESKISDHRMNGHTLMQFRFMDYDLGMPQEVFTERSLRNPPADWLKRTQ